MHYCLVSIQSALRKNANIAGEVTVSSESNNFVCSLIHSPSHNYYQSRQTVIQNTVPRGGGWGGKKSDGIKLWAPGIAFIFWAFTGPKYFVKISMPCGKCITAAIKTFSNSLSLTSEGRSSGGPVSLNLMCC